MKLPYTKTEAIEVLNTALSNTEKEDNSLHDHVDIIAGEVVTKTLTCNGAGAQNDNIFLVTGSVRIVSLVGECVEATDATTFSAVSFELYDGTASYAISQAAGTDLSGILVGGMIHRDKAVASPVTFDNNATGVFTDGSGPGVFTTEAPFRLTAKTGVATYIRFNFTGDANTDVDIKLKIRYVAISDDGMVAAV